MKFLNVVTVFIFFSVNSYCQSSQSVKLDSLFTMLHAQNQFNGEILIAEKGTVIFQKGYGFSDEATKKTIDEKTIFELASCSKQFTGAAIVLLKREGKLDYADKLSKHIPELSFWENVTLYDLLRHTSGIPDFLSGMSKDWDRSAIASNEDVIEYYASKKDTLDFEPKSIHRYSNTNYVLLASIIERVSGKKYGDYLAEKIFRPLKMNNTFVYNRRKNPAKVANYAIGYVWAPGSFKKVTMESPEYNDQMAYYLDGVEGAAKVNSNIGDIYKWIIALRNNTLFSQEEFDEMTRVTQTTKGKQIPYGFGFDVRKAENKMAFGHTGSWDGYTTLIYHDKLKDRTIIVLENFKMGVTATNNIFEILDGNTLTVEYEKKIPMSEASMIPFAGTYVDEKGNEHIITYKDNHLIYNTKDIKWDMRFFPFNRNEFAAIRQGGTNGILKFTTSDNGDIKLEMLQYGNLVGSGIKKKS
ncbi:serine hydrolase domain-containing protein [Flavobacterium sp. AG291]|uniref:serine hydrolase domain-containing protein n=1 Tax=Flavobacterium sp. AG291 TaxID=2184000 RepID=UPI000E0BC940|nr:serine hydrolase domain-containing protein [Flavobacterium sp. AG291]RDI10437.1 CubicO group peptidase (beta-lactamase class C family) [Flavobacterium sp. AG291]